MKEFTRNEIVAFTAIFSVFLMFSYGKGRNVISEASESTVTATSSVQNASSPDEAGARLEVEIKGIKTAFRWAPPGKFTRHWNKSTEGYWETKTTRDEDKEDYEITLTKGFWLAETETTQELWSTVMGEKLSEGIGEKDPVNNISWKRAQEFISKLNEDGYAPNGYEFRLPTEAQWEYACLAGTVGERYGEPDAIAWYWGNSQGQVHEVGTKEANAWGLYDMLGNVWEWCDDCYAPYPMKNATDYVGPQEGSLHVARGGGWLCNAEHCSRSYRDGDYWFHLHNRLGLVGFRISLVQKNQ